MVDQVMSRSARSLARTVVRRPVRTRCGRKPAEQLGRQKTLVAGAVAPYRILELLGSGGMGVVYLAEDTRLGRRVALKTVADGRRNAPQARRKLLREARLAARLTHPNVAAIYDLLESSDSVHVVMEYVQGETLAARIERGPLAVDEAIAVVIQLAEAVSKAHALGVIHRDLKLANVMLMPDGRVKILDFGLARSFMTVGDADDSDATILGAGERRIVGTPGYIAPEAFLGQARDARSDIYSLGVMLFELIMGRRPFTGCDMMALGMAALTEPIPRLGVLTGGLQAVIARALAPKPEDRYTSAAELAAALRSVEALATARTRPAFVRLRMPRRAWPRGAWVLAAALVALGASVATARAGRVR